MVRLRFPFPLTRLLVKYTEKTSFFWDLSWRTWFSDPVSCATVILTGNWLLTDCAKKGELFFLLKEDDCCTADTDGGNNTGN